MPTFRAPALAGDTVTAGRVPDGHRQVLFYSNTTCPHCRASLPAWKEIAEEVRLDSAVRVLGLSTHPLDSVRPYSRRHELNFPVTAFPGARELVLYQADLVPITAVVGPGGRVLYARDGRLEAPAAVDSVLDVALAGEPSADASNE